MTGFSIDKSLKTHKLDHLLIALTNDPWNYNAASLCGCENPVPSTFDEAKQLIDRNDEYVKKFLLTGDSNCLFPKYFNLLHLEETIKLKVLHEFFVACALCCANSLLRIFFVLWILCFVSPLLRRSFVSRQQRFRTSS